MLGVKTTWNHSNLSDPNLIDNQIFIHLMTEDLYSFESFDPHSQYEFGSTFFDNLYLDPNHDVDQIRNARDNEGIMGSGNPIDNNSPIQNRYLGFDRAPSSSLSHSCQDFQLPSFLLSITFLLIMVDYSFLFWMEPTILSFLFFTVSCYSAEGKNHNEIEPYRFLHSCGTACHMSHIMSRMKIWLRFGWLLQMQSCSTITLFHMRQQVCGFYSIWNWLIQKKKLIN